MNKFEVFKSGGTSTGTPEGYGKILDLIKSKPNERIVLVVSAPTVGDLGTTELLRKKNAGEDTTAAILSLYDNIANHFGIMFPKEEFTKDIDTKKYDALLALGEHYQAKLMAEFLSSRGINAKCLDARDVLSITNNSGRNIVEDVNSSPFQQGNSQVYVIGGFYGRDKSSGHTLTLPRSGSDITADVIAASLNASQYTNLKEVEGIFAANPKLVPNAKCLEELTYREIRELAYGGAQVLQEEAMTWSRRAQVPIIVRSLLYPNSPGTRIVSERDYTKSPIVGIAAKKDFSVFKIIRENRDGFFPQLFDFFSRRGISIDMVGTETIKIKTKEFEQEKSLVSIAIENKQFNERYFEANLSQKFDIDNEYQNVALISIVGEGINDPLALRARIINVLDNEVIASYGPILGGVQTGTTIYHIEKFGMNSEKGYLQRLTDLFQEQRIPITGISTTIDSISLGTNMLSSRNEMEEISDFIKECLAPDMITITRNGLIYAGTRSAISNITVAVPEVALERDVENLYREFF